MPIDDERLIERLLGEMIDAWNRGDAKAYGARYLADATFTNANGSFYVGRDEFDRRHEEIFRGLLGLKDADLRQMREEGVI